MSMDYSKSALYFERCVNVLFSVSLYKQIQPSGYNSPAMTYLWPTSHIMPKYMALPEIFNTLFV